MRAYKVTDRLEAKITSGASETPRFRAAELQGDTIVRFEEPPPTAKSEERWLALLEDDSAD